MLLAPLSNAEYEELMSDKSPPKPRTMPSEIQLRRCANCREIATAGSLADGMSRCCYSPLVGWAR
jgi:hypothetical protein